MSRKDNVYHVDFRKKKSGDVLTVELPEVIYKEIASIAQFQKINPADVVRKIFKYGLLVIKIMDNPKMKLFIEDKNGMREIIE